VRTFVAVVDLRSFTKAAANLGVTQPAVSAQIKRLQSLLGGDLFDRSVQGVSLTRAISRERRPRHLRRIGRRHRRGALRFARRPCRAQGQQRGLTPTIRSDQRPAA
jgi:DNA-binding transcriptional LysR family regulator